MGTRADFYIGRGKKAEWLGSIAWDGSDIPRKLRHAKTEADFRAALARFVKTRDDWTKPEDGWPWPWDDSTLTDEVWAFDGDRVWNANGYPVARWVDATVKQLRFDDDENALELWYAKQPKAIFPNMAKRKKVTTGTRSGLIVIGDQ